MENLGEMNEQFLPKIFSNGLVQQTTKLVTIDIDGLYYPRLYIGIIS